MPILIPYIIAAAALSLLTCLLAGWTGLSFAGFLLLLFLAWYIGLMALTVVFAWLITLPVNKDKKQTEPSPFYRRFLDFGMWFITSVCGVKVHLSGEEKMPEGRFLLVGNHRSAFDPIITGSVMQKRQLAFITKPENMRIPIAGGLIHKCCFLPIDRENDREALMTILTAIDLIKRDQVSIAVYPEGTRSTGKELLPFRNGAFKIAQKAKVPIVVAVIKGSEDVKKNMFRRRTHVYLEIRRVMSVEEISEWNTVEIGEKVRECIQAGLAG